MKNLITKNEVTNIVWLLTKYDYENDAFIYGYWLTETFEIVTVKTYFN